MLLALSAFPGPKRRHKLHVVTVTRPAPIDADVATKYSILSITRYPLNSSIYDSPLKLKPVRRDDSMVSIVNVLTQKSSSIDFI